MLAAGAELAAIEGEGLTTPAGAGLAGDGEGFKIPAGAGLAADEAAGVVFEDGLAAIGGFAALFEVVLATDCWGFWLLNLAG